MLQILPYDFDVDDIYRNCKGEDFKEEISILGAYDLHNKKTKKLIGIDFNELSWSRYVESRRKVALFITKFYKRKDVRLKDFDLKFIKDLEYFFWYHFRYFHLEVIYFWRHCHYDVMKESSLWKILIVCSLFQSEKEKNDIEKKMTSYQRMI